jgi:hypothetical protein
VVGCIISLLFFWAYDLFRQSEAKPAYLILSNGFFYSGILVFGVGVLVFLSNEGTFNFLSYAVQKLLSRFVHTMKVATMNYTDFTLYQNQRPKAPFGFLLWVGLFFILLAGIFVLLYYFA